MTRISFYVLKGNNEQHRQLFACRLIEKAYYQGQQIYIHTESEQQTTQLNHSLWSFRSDSFIPHQVVSNDNSDEQSPILVSHHATPPKLMNLLINLAAEQPGFFSQFERVAEFVNEDPAIKTAGRARYRFYQQRGYELETFTI
ncbi:MAG: DNA polymerase III subunit chi [Methylophaga sp.]|nr:MAG: DNA polymerase III subunit chi [Methylophaga sp.]